MSVKQIQWTIAAVFAFNIWFIVIDPVFTQLGWLDAVGNLIMVAMCWHGWRKAACLAAQRSLTVSMAT